MYAVSHKKSSEANEGASAANENMATFGREPHSWQCTERKCTERNVNAVCRRSTWNTIRLSKIYLDVLI